MELGDFNNADNIASDDESPAVLDPEALDSDDDPENAELGIDLEDSEGMQPMFDKTSRCR